MRRSPARSAGRRGVPGLPVSAPAPACSSLTSERRASPPGWRRTTCPRSSLTRRAAGPPRPPGAPRSRSRDCMGPGASPGTGRGSGASRVPDGRCETARRGGQEAAPRRVRRKLLPPARPAQPSRAALAQRGEGNRTPPRGRQGGAPAGLWLPGAPHPPRPHLRWSPWIPQAGL